MGVDCAIAACCGGCAWIGLDAAEQLRRKRERVVEALAAVGLDVAVEPCVPAPRPSGYRNRAKLAVARVDGEVLIGLHRRGTAEVVDLGDCPVHDDATRRVVAALRDWIAEHGLARPDGAVKYVDIREGVHVTLVVSEQATLPLASLRERLPALVGISVNVNPRDSSYPFGERTRTPWGERTFMAGPLEVPATGFFQVNADLLPAVHERMRAHLAGRGGRLLDLYCGVGTHGLSLAAEFDDLLGVERSTPAISCARRNADRLGVAGRFVAAPVTPRVLEAPIDAIVLNPGRAGADAATLDALPRVPIAYLSCEPATLARDLARLGRPIDAVVPFDFMPQTDQVESLALIDRASASIHSTSPGRTRQRG